MEHGLHPHPNLAVIHKVRFERAPRGHDPMRGCTLAGVPRSRLGDPSL